MFKKSENKPKKQKDVDKSDKQQWQQYLNETKGLERDYMAEIVKSRKHWQLLGLASFLFAICMVAWHQFMPNTSTEPYVFRVDNTTGAVESVSTLNNQEQTYGEAVDRYFLAGFVRSYESYNYQNIQNDYDKIGLMTNDQVKTQYMKIYDPNTGNSRDKVLGELGTRQVNIISVVPSVIDGAASATAAVRFETVTTNAQGGSITENWIANITYEYISASINDEVRLVNPLGFVVTSYRADKENL